MGEFKIWMESKGKKPSAGLVVVSGNRVLMIKTHRGWELPKGRVEEGEKASETAVRETEEETGIRASSGSLVGTVTSPGGRRCDFFRGVSLSGKLRAQKSEGIKKVKWVPVSKAREKIIEWQRRLLDHL